MQRVLNEMGRARHIFTVLYYCKLHNSLVDAMSLGHLNPYPHGNPMKAVSTPYPCTTKSKKVLKRPARQVAKKPASATRSVMKSRRAVRKVLKKPVRRQ